MFLKIVKKDVDRFLTWCYIYYDRCTTTDVATTDKVTTAVVKKGRQRCQRKQQGPTEADARTRVRKGTKNG